MVPIRPFDEDDNASMLEIEKLCPQGNEKCAVGVDKRDIIARYELYDNWKVPVAEEEGEVVGWIGWTVKHSPAQKEKYMYLTEVMVHPEFRRKGIASDAMSNLIGYFNNILLDAKRDFFAAQLDPNDSLFEIIKRFKPQVDSCYVFAKAFEGELPEFSPFYIDIRDCIL